MRTTQKLMVALMTILTLPIFAQTTISGVTLPETNLVNNDKMVLNGGGLREKLWIDLYVGGLYLQNKNSDAKAIINSDAPMSMYLEIVSKLITREKFLEAVNEGFKNATNGNTEKFSKEIKAFKDAFSDEIVKGDVIDIQYIPNTGVVVFKNKKKVVSVKGLEFKKILFAIWLGDKPADKKLKDGMLGK